MTWHDTLTIPPFNFHYFRFDTPASASDRHTSLLHCIRCHAASSNFFGTKKTSLHRCGYRNIDSWLAGPACRNSEVFLSCVKGGPRVAHAFLELWWRPRVAVMRGPCVANPWSADRVSSLSVLCDDIVSSCFSFGIQFWASWARACINWMDGSRRRASWALIAFFSRCHYQW
jgi:hypothetical protein